MNQIPIIDVDLSSPAKNEMKTAGRKTSDDTTDNNEADKAAAVGKLPDQQLARALDHFEDMKTLERLYSPWLHVSRCLDQTYIESLHGKELELRNNDQVLYKYLERMLLSRREAEST